jgi:hypothetical protein
MRSDIMDYLPYLAAIIISVFEIIGHRDIRERLHKDYPDVGERDYYPSDTFMYILIIVEIILLAIEIIK